jgi:hypothetical protein
MEALEVSGVDNITFENSEIEIIMYDVADWGNPWVHQFRLARVVCHGKRSVGRQRGRPVGNPDTAGKL